MTIQWFVQNNFVREIVNIVVQDTTRLGKFSGVWIVCKNVSRQRCRWTKQLNFLQFSHKNSLNPKEMEMFFFSLRAGSPFSHARAAKSKRSGGRESSEEAPRKFPVSRLRRSISTSRLCRAHLCSNVSLLAGHVCSYPPTSLP